MTKKTKKVITVFKTDRSNFYITAEDKKTIGLTVNVKYFDLIDIGALQTRKDLTVVVKDLDYGRTLPSVNKKATQKYNLFVKLRSLKISDPETVCLVKSNNRYRIAFTGISFSKKEIKLSTKNGFKVVALDPNTTKVIERFNPSKKSR